MPSYQAFARYNSLREHLVVSYGSSVRLGCCANQEHLLSSQLGHFEQGFLLFDPESKGSQTAPRETDCSEQGIKWRFGF